MLIYIDFCIINAIIDIKKEVIIMPEKSPAEIRKEKKRAQRIALGKRIAFLRIQAGFETQTELAKKLPGITPNLISNWELGYGAPDIFAVPLICSALNCTYAEFFGGELFAFTQEEIAEISKVATLSKEDRQICLAFADFLRTRHSGPASEK